MNLQKDIRMNDTENLLKHINYLCYKFHLFGVFINNYLIVLLDGKHSFPYNLKNSVWLTVIFIHIFPDIGISYDDNEMSRVAHHQGKVISIFALKTSDHDPELEIDAIKSCSKLTFNQDYKCLVLVLSNHLLNCLSVSQGLEHYFIM